MLAQIVREMTDHEAVQAMKDSNKQRDGMLPSELAALLELEVEDIKHQGGRLKGVAEGDVGKRSVEIVGEAHEMNYKKVIWPIGGYSSFAVDYDWIGYCAYYNFGCYLF